MAVAGVTLCGFAELKYLPPPGLEEKKEYARRDVAKGNGWRSLFSIETSDAPSESRYAGFENIIAGKCQSPCVLFSNLGKRWSGMDPDAPMTVLKGFLSTCKSVCPLAWKCIA